MPLPPMRHLLLVGVFGLVASLPAQSPAAKNTAASNIRPCDIYNRAHTPCVAAFSTTRVLFAAYAGPLYQVTRQSDKTARNIGILSDGYANAATQDGFCDKTTCTITRIYDQSSRHNDLTVAPPGGAAHGRGPGGDDLPAVANALPVTAGGHRYTASIFRLGWVTATTRPPVSQSTVNLRGCIW
jgi:hypothetical protein